MPDRIIHLSNTPLAGAPARLSRTLNRLTDWDSLCFLEQDYKSPMNGLFTDNCFVLSGSDDDDCFQLLRESLLTAEIIHVHNYITPRIVTLLMNTEFKASVVYHLHSPTREGPLYVSRQPDIRVPVARTLVVAQMHPRFYETATPVPNIVPAAPPSLRPEPDGKIRILYAPAQLRAGRWNGKACRELNEAMDAVAHRPDVEVVKLSRPQPSHVLERIRAMCDITIDEVATGGFHQISLEGLQAGNAVINGADEISQRIMMGWTGGERPPFVVSSPRTIGDDLQRLIEDREYLESCKAASREFARKHLQPADLIKIYERTYADILGRS